MSNNKTLRISLSEPSISGNEWKYVKECLDTGWVSTAGKFVDLFERKICEYTNSGHAVACINGTSALHIALRVVGVQSGDEVIVPALTFIAPINAVRYLDAHPVFMDCDNFYNIDIEKTINFITEETELKNGTTYNCKTKRRISAIIPVHIFGNAVDLEKLLKLCRERNIKIVEDATESLGSVYTRGEIVKKHTGTVGDIGCYSFNGNKIITSGGGGMIVTDNEEYAKRAKYLTTQSKDDALYFTHNEVGYNYRLTNIQAAIGVAQLEQLPEYINIKKKNYEKYKSKIDIIKGLHLSEVPSYSMSNYWFYCLQVEKKEYGIGANNLMLYLREHNIDTRPVWQLNHLQKPYQNCQTYKIENANRLQKKSLNIPCSVSLDSMQMKKVLNCICNASPILK
ncbi:MAG: LegC family aminotransferase [Deltaproteobacteria bacterium]|nr:LegC family aminotransferase [Deltaproteobacteria bacterium]